MDTTEAAAETVAGAGAAMTDRRPLVRLFTAAGAMAAFVALTGCSDGGGAEPVPALVSTVADASTAADADTNPDTTATPTTAPASAPPTAPAVDGGALLQHALEAIAGGYHFTTTVNVDGAATLVADGDRVADGTRLTISGDGGTVAYVITPAGSWVLPEDGEWEAVDAPAATADPIAALWTPTSVAVDGVEGTVTRLTTTVAAAALGIAGDEPATLQVTLEGSELRSVTYTSSLDGRPAAVQATITPLVDTSPVIAPV